MARSAATARIPGPPRARAPREVELKYRVRDSAALSLWLDGPWLEGLDGVVMEPPVTTEVEDRYFDTPHGALERSGFGARLRRRGNVTTLTVKSHGQGAAVGGPGAGEEGDRDGRGRNGATRDDGRAPGGRGGGPRDGVLARPRALHRRIELEAPATPRLDPAAWPSSPARELVDELRGAARLHIRFTVRQRRHVRRLVAPEGVALLSFDEVEVLAGHTPVGTFCELEIESADASTGLLERLTPVLAANELLTPEPRSKEELARGMVAEHDATSGQRTPPRVPKTPGVRMEDTLAEAGRKVLRMHLARMIAAEPGTRAGEDIEELHKMRVATRRMRAAWRVFDGAYRTRLQRRYVRELGSVATALGTVRDLDVQLEGLDAYIAQLTPSGASAMEPLRAEWRRQRAAGRERLVTLLDSREYRDFVEDYLDFVETRGAGERGTQPGQPVLVRDTAAGRLWSAYERVRAHDTVLAWADVAALHALRIDAKRLRYTLEAFSEVLPPRALQLIGTVTAMQDHLGLLNDADVAAHLTRAWLTARASRTAGPTREAVGHYLESREAEVQRLRRTFGPVWRRITGSTFRRGLALSVAAL